jgi:hypothetical protein
VFLVLMLCVCVDFIHLLVFDLISFFFSFFLLLVLLFLLFLLLLLLYITKN